MFSRLLDLLIPLAAIFAVYKLGPEVIGLAKWKTRFRTWRDNR